MSEITMREANELDVPLILRFIRELADYERLLHLVEATEDTLRESLFGAHAAAEVMLAYDGETPAGFALFFHNFSTFIGRPGLYLEDIYVKPEFRGRGIGRMFFRELAKIAKHRHCGRMEWAVLDWNRPAISFYERLGAGSVDEWTIFRMTEKQFDSLIE